MYAWLHALATIRVMKEPLVVGGFAASEQAGIWQRLDPTMHPTGLDISTDHLGTGHDSPETDDNFEIIASTLKSIYDVLLQL